MLKTAVPAIAQLPFGLNDDRTSQRYCGSCIQKIESKPVEVLFGIHIQSNGDIYFTTNNREWLDKILENNLFGVTVDIVSRDRYNCNARTVNQREGLPRGTMLYPVYKPDLLKGKDKLTQGGIYVKIGQLPPALKNKEVEGNLVIVNGNQICYYSNFLDIDRSAWQLLPMGLYTDSLLQESKAMNTAGDPGFFTYTRVINLEIPFAKGSSKIDPQSLKAIYDSVQLSRYRMRKVEIRAYSSVEGSEVYNRQLMQQRAETIVREIKKYDASLNRVKILTAENWLDFYRAVVGTELEPLKEQSKQVIKQKLADKAILDKAEPILAGQRKAIISLYVSERTPVSNLSGDSLVIQINRAAAQNEINRARLLLKELAEQIADNKLPSEYMYQLEIPETINCGSLLNDREVYKYLLHTTSERDMLENLLRFKKFDPDNGRMNYNICALRTLIWQMDNDPEPRQLLPAETEALSRQGIGELLVKRLRINYHLLKSEEDLRNFNYRGKDSSVATVRELYAGLPLFDEDRYSMAKYYQYHSHGRWAMEVVQPRVDKIDVSEDLVFYYVNMKLFYPDEYEDEDFQRAATNAAILNRERFCRLFSSTNNGGAGMQLLDYEALKKLYCQWCN